MEFAQSDFQHLAENFVESVDALQYERFSNLILFMQRYAHRGKHGGAKEKK
jgi:hypothetical protein